MLNPSYENYTAEMLVEDDSFRRWVLQENAEATDFWQTFLQEYPDSKKEITTAISWLKAIHFHYEEKTTAEEQQASFQQIQDRIQTGAEAPIIQLKPTHNRRIWQMAASIALLIGLSIGGVLYWNSINQTVLYATEFGEQERIELADGSVVILNSNSTLTHTAKSSREVWLSGEGYFEVSDQKEEGIEFIVHTDHLDVEVYGTEFNVNSRATSTEVVLDEGSVQLSLKGENQEKIEMSPGDIVLYNSETTALNRSTTSTEALTAWKDGNLVFDRASLQEVIDRLEEIYEIEVDLQQTTIADLPIRATFPVDNLDECLETLSLLLLSEGVDLRRTGNEVIIK
ncbi:MAG: FecR domain-containing protein [Bacteroidota bacterium]